MKIIRKNIKVSLALAISLLLIGGLMGFFTIKHVIPESMLYAYISIYLIAITLLFFCIKAILNVNKDFLAQKKTDEIAFAEVTARLDFFMAVIENIQDGIIACDKMGDLVLFNKATRILHGPLEYLPADEWVRHYKLYYPDGVTPFKMEDIPLFKAFRGEEVVNIEMVLAPLHGKRKIVLVCGNQIKTADGDILGAVINIHDITELKESEIQANELISEDYFRELSDQIPIMIWKVNNEGEASYVNKSWINFTGLSFDESLYYGWIQAVHPDDREAEKEIFNSFFTKQIGYQSKFRLKQKNGTYRWVLSQGTPLFNPEFEGYIGSFTDINEQELAQQATKLLMQKKDEFMGIASHELKTPITSMKASLQVVERLTANNPDIVSVHDYIQKARRQVNKIAILIENLLDITKIQAGKMEFTISNFQIREVIQDCLDQINQDLNSHKISVINNDDLFLNADKPRLEQVITNFLSNALKYSPEGSEIIIEYKKEDENLFLSVTDFGIGISADEIPFIFDRFFRVQETSQKFSGLGLGLYITSEIINRHSGKIGVQSEEGKGSTFWFSIPLNEDQNSILANKYYINDQTDINLR